MIEAQQTITLSQADLDHLESALETQSKIFNLQAQAGNRGARERLNGIKRTLASLSSQRVRADGAQSTRSSWLGSFWCAEQS